MSTRLKIWSLPLITAAIFVLGVLVVWVASNRTLATTRAVGDAHLPFLEATALFSNQLGELSAAFQTAVAEGDKKLLDDVKKRATQLRETLTKMAAVTAHAEDAKLLAKDFESYVSSAQLVTEVFLKVREGDSASLLPKMQAAQNVLNERVKQTQVKLRADLKQGLQSVEAGVISSLYTSIASCVLAVGVLGVASWLLIGSVWRQLGGEPEYARDLLHRMAKGDLSQRVQLLPGDSTSLLAAVNSLGDGLRAMMSEVVSSTASITNVSREIASGNRNLSARSEEQASSLERTAAGVEEFTATVKENAQHSRMANQLAINTAEVATRGGVVVGEVVETMGSIATSSKKISEIIGVIDSIAFQTNILALNAAVEAARAGEQGRGFAVVASEVRSLALRSAQASKEIGSLINAAVEQVQHGSALVKRAGETMAEVVHSVRQVTEIVSSITVASEAQAQGVSSVGLSISQIDSATQQNAALAQQAAGLANDLQTQTDALTTAAARFNLQEALA